MHVPPSGGGVQWISRCSWSRRSRSTSAVFGRSLERMACRRLALRAVGPHRSPTRVPDSIEDQIVALRKRLADIGVDAGPDTIHTHLTDAHSGRAPCSVSSIWRILRRRGFIVPEPDKRPKSCYTRFEARLPNECWQVDITYVALRNGHVVEALNLIDDHSRLCAPVASSRSPPQPTSSPRSTTPPPTWASSRSPQRQRRDLHRVLPRRPRRARHRTRRCRRGTRYRLDEQPHIESLPSGPASQPSEPFSHRARRTTTHRVPGAHELCSPVKPPYSLTTGDPDAGVHQRKEDVGHEEYPTHDDNALHHPRRRARSSDEDVIHADEQRRANNQHR
jgi:hypothetical protein